MGYEELLKELGEVPYKRLLMGEWLPWECEECHMTENVARFRERSGKEKHPIYLCWKCYDAGPGSRRLQEWKE